VPLLGGFRILDRYALETSLLEKVLLEQSGPSEGWLRLTDRDYYNNRIASVL
jgi:hypothetical protein